MLHWSINIFLYVELPRQSWISLYYVRFIFFTDVTAKLLHIGLSAIDSVDVGI